MNTDGLNQLKAQSKAKHQASPRTVERLPVDFSQPLQRVYAVDLQNLLRIKRSLFYKRLSQGRYPPPDGKDGLRPYWLVRTILKFLDPAAIDCNPENGQGV